jgi:glycosyltransferase involved in cell wall biosynthesis
MNILHVVDQLGSDSGGPARVVYALSKEQVKLGHKITIYSSDYKADGQKPPEGVEMFLIPALTRFHRLILSPGFMVQDYKQFNIVHLHNYRTLPNLMLSNKGVKLILQAHGNAHPSDSFKHALAYPVWRHALIPRCSMFIADAEDEVKHYLKEGAKPEQIRVVPLGVDMDEFRNVKPPEKNGHKSILYLGRIHKEKGLDVLLRAFAIMKRPGVRLEIAGPDDGFEDSCRGLARTWGIENKVDWLGTLEGEAKAQVYASADVYVMPSRYEMFGLSVLEAAACGTPVIVTDKCAIAKQLPRECGSVTSLDEHRMANDIGQMLDSNYQCFYRTQRQRWAEQYSWVNIAKRICEVYQEVLTIDA